MALAVHESVNEMTIREQATETPANMAVIASEFLTQNASLNKKIDTFDFESIPVPYRSHGESSRKEVTTTFSEEDLQPFDVAGAKNAHVLWLPCQFGRDAARPRTSRAEDAIDGILKVLGDVEEIGLDEGSTRVSKGSIIKTSAKSDDHVAVHIELFKVKSEDGKPEMIVALMTRRGGAMSNFFAAAKKVEEKIKEAWQAALKD